MQKLRKTICKTSAFYSKCISFSKKMYGHCYPHWSYIFLIIIGKPLPDSPHNGKFFLMYPDHKRQFLLIDNQ